LDRRHLHRPPAPLWNAAANAINTKRYHLRASSAEYHAFAQSVTPTSNTTKTTTREKSSTRAIASSTPSAFSFAAPCGRRHFHSSPLAGFAEKDEAKETAAAQAQEETPPSPPTEEPNETSSSTASSAPVEGDEPKDEASPEEANKPEAATEDDAAAATEGDESPPVDPNEVKYAFSPAPPLSQASQDKVQAIFDKILWLDMIEVHLLTQVVNEQLGISWKETEAMMSGGGGGVVAKSGAADAGGEPEAAEAKTIFDLKLVGFDAKAKIKVIKEVRTIAGLGLKEAKELVESAPKVIQKELKQEKADELKAQLEAVGAEVELV